MPYDMEDDYRTVNAVLWEFDSWDENGRQKVKAPVDITVRWQEIDEELKDSDGRIIRATDWLVVGQEIPEHSIIGKGTVASPPTSGFRSVIRSMNTDDVKGESTRRTVKCRTFGDTLPTLA